MTDDELAALEAKQPAKGLTDDEVAGAAPAAPPASKKPAAPFIPETPPSLGEVAKGVGRDFAQPFVDLGKSAWAGLGAIGDDILHPVRTFQGSPLGRGLGVSTPEAVERNQAEQREVMRGVNSNLPGANTLVERLGGPAAESAEDAALVPGAQAVGTASGLPVGGMAAEAGGAMLGRGLTAARKAGAASVERSAVRHAASAAPVKEAVKEAAAEVKKHAIEIATHAVIGQALGGHGAGLAGLNATARLGKPVAKAAGVALDEATAAMFRKFLARDAGEAAAVPVAAAYEPPAPKLLGSAPIEVGPMTAEAAPPAQKLLGPMAPEAAPVAAPVAPVAPVAPAPPVAVAPRVSSWRPLETTGTVPGAAERRPVESTGFNRTVDRVGRALQNAETSQDFVRKAVAQGMDARDARKIYREARPFTPGQGSTGPDLLTKTLAAANEGNPWAVRQITKLQRTPGGAAKIAEAARLMQAVAK